MHRREEKRREEKRREEKPAVIDDLYASRPPRVYREYGPTLRINCGQLKAIVVEETNDQY